MFNVSSPLGQLKVSGGGATNEGMLIDLGHIISLARRISLARHNSFVGHILVLPDIF